VTRLVLASSSTYRRRLLLEAGWEADVVVPTFDERSLDPSFDEWGVDRYVVEVALGKARSVIDRVDPDVVLIAADQVAVHDGRLLTKPATLESAVQQLMSLSGSTHELVNGVVAMRPGGRRATAVDRHVVTMESFGLDEAEAYVAEFRPLDSVGAYRIEDDAGLLASVVGSGDDGVIGLPIGVVRRLLAEVTAL
jgi:septum formation protein